MELVNNNRITFNNTRYHLNGIMEQWCRDTIGEGKWIGEPCPKDWTGLPDWTIHSMFGNTTFAFKHARHYTWFILRWN
jgi:hypothetical protein